MEYDLELQKAVDTINKENHKTVLIQLPDGLKPKAEEITRIMHSKTKAKVQIWLGSCYGSCDIPNIPKNIPIDLLIQWGHSEWQ